MSTYSDDNDNYLATDFGGSSTNELPGNVTKQ